MAETSKAAAAGAAATTVPADELLGKIIDQTKPADQEQRKRNQGFIEEVVRHALAASPGSLIGKDISKTIQGWICDIDAKVSVQLNEVMHHPEFQTLEGTWRGLKYLIDQSETGEHLKIRVMNVNKKTLAKNLERAVEFDQSALFKKVYEEEYGTLGGAPYGMLVGDYEFGRHPTDVELLKKLAGVAAAAHAPFVSAA